MALIGEMQYLTIGGNTYSIPISGGSTVTITRSLTSGTKSATISVDGTDYDLYAPTPNAGTVTSVRVQATSPVQSSTSTAQSGSLNTTISLKDAYGDTKNPYGTKTANYVLAGPTSGSASAPSFRALVAADIPDLSSTYLTSYTETDPTVPSWAKASTKPTYTASEVGAVATSAVGAASGVAPLNASSKIDSTYLPSYVDDVIEGYYYNNKFYTTSAHTTQITGETGKIFVDLSTNKTYRYSGSTFTEVSQGSIVSINRNLTSGTKSATITIDGTGYDLYAPTPPTVPTNISAFTNDAGYITSADVPEGASAYTGTISAVGTSASAGTNNGFARGDHVHNITKTTINSVLGTGSGTTKFYREDGTWATPAYIANTDEQLKVAEVTSATQYYPLVGTGTAAATRQYDTTGFKYKGTNGTTSAVGSAILELGNSTASGTTNNKQGQLIMYGSNTKKATITLAAPSADITLALPTSGGTLALTSQIPTVSYPVTSVNSKTGAVSLTYSDVGAAASGHTHTTSIAESTGTNQITLGYGKKYSLTAGGTSYIFTMPSADDTNTWRKVQLDGTDKLGTGTSTNPLNLKAGTNVSITESSGTFTFSATDTNTDTKVTSVDNHYAPSANTDSQLSVDASSTTSATWGSTSLVTGVNLQRDAKGHVVGVTVDSIRMPANPDTNTHQTIKQDGVTGATGNHFGTSSTAAATAAKTVSITAGTPALETGLRVTVKFTYANTANSPTLNVNSLGAKNIFHNGAQITSGSNKALLAGTVEFVYDGTQWQLVGNYVDTNTTYSVPTKANSNTTGITASTTATKTTLGTAFTIPNVTGGGSGSASISGAVENNDTLVITISHTHNPATFGTAFTVPNVTGNTSATVSITDPGHTHTLS